MSKIKKGKWKCKKCGTENEMYRSDCKQCGHEPTTGRRDVHPEGRRHTSDQQEPGYLIPDKWVK